MAKTKKSTPKTPTMPKGPMHEPGRQKKMPMPGNKPMGC